MRKINISFDERGVGETIVLLHGFPLDRRAWSACAEKLARKYRVITPDLPGFGDSQSTEPFTIDSLARDMRAFLEQTGALPCVLGGLSMGGYVAMEFASKFVADLKGLILADTRSENDTPEGRQARNDLIELAKTKGSAAVAEKMLPKMLAPAASPNDRAALTQIMSACPALTIQHACAAMRDRQDYTKTLQSLAVPALIVVGEDDQLTIPEMSRHMHEALPRSELVVIPNAGHMAPWEKPQEVADAITAFLAGIAPNR